MRHPALVMRSLAAGASPDAFCVSSMSRRLYFRTGADATTEVLHGGSSRRFFTVVPTAVPHDGSHGGSLRRFPRRFLTTVPHDGSSRRFPTAVPNGGSQRRFRRGFFTEVL